jgi:hypothetical protein
MATKTPTTINGIARIVGRTFVDTGGVVHRADSRLTEVLSILPMVIGLAANVGSDEQCHLRL